MGLAAHGMGGFYPEKCYEVTGLSSNDYEAMAVVAVGYRGTLEQLDPNYQSRESELYSKRNPVEEFTKRF